MKKITYLTIFLTISGIVILVNLLPNYHGWLNTPTDFFFSGQASWFDPWDINVYVAAIKWGQKDNILLQNLYTTDIQKSAFIYPMYTLLGKLFSKTNPFLLFHLLAIVTGFLLCVGIFLLAYSLLNNAYHSLIALALISLGGGLGWLFVNKFYSADLFITSFTFTSAFQRPHEAVGILLYMTSLILFSFSVQRINLVVNVFTLFTLFLLVFYYPYYILSYAIISGIYTLTIVNKKGSLQPVFTLGIDLFLSSLLAFFYLAHLKSSGFTSVTTQNLTRPGLTAIALGYGIFLPLYIYQLFALKIKEDKKIFLNIWFLVSLLLSFFPFGFTRFYLRGLFFPLVLLSLMAVPGICKKTHISKQFIVLVLLIFTPLSSFYIFHKRITEVDKSNKWFYQPLDIKKGFKLLENSKNDGVLAGYVLGNYIPAHTGKRVYFGHLIQTPNAEEKVTAIANFFSGKLDPLQALRFLQKNKISFIIYSNEEKNLGELNYKFLKKTYSSDNMKIFMIDKKAI